MAEPAVVFRSWCLFPLISYFSPPNLGRCLADHHQNVLLVRWSSRFVKLGINLDSVSPKSSNISAEKLWFQLCNFGTLLQISSTWYRKSENGIAKCNVSLALWLNLVYFGHNVTTCHEAENSDVKCNFSHCDLTLLPEQQKIRSRVSTCLMGGHHAGLYGTF